MKIQYNGCNYHAQVVGLAKDGVKMEVGFYSTYVLLKGINIFRLLILLINSIFAIIGITYFRGSDGIVRILSSIVGSLCIFYAIICCVLIVLKALFFTYTDVSDSSENTAFDLIREYENKLRGGNGIC